MKLLVISNHPPDRWDEKQKKGWERIDYIPFPNVSPEADFSECADIAARLAGRIGEWIGNNPDGKVCLQGEFTVCYIIFKAIDDDIFVFPTTERVVEEKEDGIKISKFLFVRWRGI